MEDETVMNSGTTEPTPRGSREERPAIADVGFNRVLSDREDTPIAPLSEPWEQIVDATQNKKPRTVPKAPVPKPALAKAPVPKAPPPKTLPPLKKKSVSLPPRRTENNNRHHSSLDADTDEGVVQVPPDPDAFASLHPVGARPQPSQLPPFGADEKSWPSGATKPVAPSLKRAAAPEKRKSDLLENKPVTGAKYPPRPPNEMTLAAPGELAGIVEDRSPAVRPELVDDLLSPAALRKDASADREQRRAEMRKSVETTSPEELRSVNRSKTVPPPRRDLEDTGDVMPPQSRLEETRAFFDSPLSRPQAASSNIMPLPAIEDTLRKGDAKPFGQTQACLLLASGKRRLLALLIDAVVVLAIVAVPSLLGLFGDAISTADWFDPDDVTILLMQGKLTVPLIVLTLLIVMFSALSHGLMGRSLGKLICGLEVVRKKTGARTGFVRATVRAFLSLFSLLLGGAGYLWLIVDRRARTLHDYLTGTVVIVAASRTDAARSGESFVHEPTL